LPDARHRFRTAVEIEPESADSWALLGVVCIEGGWSDEAASALERALSLQPSHLLARNSLGVLCEDLGREREALRHYRAALRLHPGFMPAKKNLARVLRSCQRTGGRAAR
jgi:protein O-GlcNAc transferase